jgi:RecA/RadA recombinase
VVVALVELVPAHQAEMAETVVQDWQILFQVQPHFMQAEEEGLRLRLVEQEVRVLEEMVQVDLELAIRVHQIREVAVVHQLVLVHYQDTNQVMVEAVL